MVLLRKAYGSRAIERMVSIIEEVGFIVTGMFDNSMCWHNFEAINKCCSVMDKDLHVYLIYEIQSSEFIIKYTAPTNVLSCIVVDPCASSIRIAWEFGRFTARHQ